MVGLPYPNIKSPELAEKMQYLNSTLASDLHVLDSVTSSRVSKYPQSTVSMNPNTKAVDLSTQML